MLIKKISSKIKSTLSKNKFFKNVFILVSGTVIGQLILILSSPILTRLYTPDEFGVFSTYVAIIGIIASVITLRYHIAIPLPDRKKEALNLFVLSILIVFIFSLISFFIIVLLKFEVIKISFLSLSAIGNIIYIIPIGLLGIGLYSILNYWAIRDSAYKEISKTKVNQGIGTVSTQIGLGSVNSGSIGLIVGQVIGHTVGISTLFKSFLKENRNFWRSISIKSLLKVIKDYKNFPLYSTWTAIINKSGSQLPVLILTFYFGPAVTGFYALGLRVMQTPVTIVGKAISQVYYSSAVKYKKNKTIDKFTKQIFIALLQVGMPTLLLFGLLAEDVFTLVFGENWGVGGIYASYLVPWVLLTFISSPLSIIPSIYNRQGYELIFQMLMFSVRIIILIYGGLIGDPHFTILSFSIASAIIWFIFVMWNMSLVGIRKISVVIMFIQELLITFVMLSPIILSQLYTDNYVILIGATLLSGIIILYRITKKIKEVKNV